MKRFLTQAGDYEGRAVAVARHFDHYDEEHVIVKMSCCKDTYYLDWIGGALAEQPDEFMDCPFESLSWETVK